MATKKKVAADNDESKIDRALNRLNGMDGQKTWIVYTISAELTGPSHIDRDRQMRAFRETLGIYEHHEHLIRFEGTRIIGTLRTLLRGRTEEDQWQESIKDTLAAHKIPVVAMTYAIDENGTQIAEWVQSTETERELAAATL